MNQGENYQDFLNCGGGVFLGHCLIIIKLAWEFFPKICYLTPPTIRHKRVKNRKWRNQFRLTKKFLTNIWMLVFYEHSNTVEKKGQVNKAIK